MGKGWGTVAPREIVQQQEQVVETCVARDTRAELINIPVEALFVLALDFGGSHFFTLLAAGGTHFGIPRWSGAIF